MALQNVEMFLVWSVWLAYVPSTMSPTTVVPVVRRPHLVFSVRTAPKMCRVECSAASSTTINPNHWSQPIHPIIWKMSFLVANTLGHRSLLPGSSPRKIHTEHLLWLVGCGEKRFWGIKWNRWINYQPLHLHEAIILGGGNRCRLLVAGQKFLDQWKDVTKTLHTCFTRIPVSILQMVGQSRQCQKQT